MNKYRLLMAVGLAAVLALAGCGGGSPQGMTPEQRAELADMALQAAKTAVDKVTDDSEEATVAAADTAMAAAEEVVGAASDAENHAALTQRLGRLQGDLAGKRVARTAATQRAEAAEEAAAEAAEEAAAAETARLMKAAVDRLYTNIQKGDATFYAAPNLDTGRPFYDLNVEVQKGENHVLKEDTDATVAAIKGWQGVKFSTTDSGDTYEAYAYTDMDEGSLRTLKDIYTSDYDDATGVLANESLNSNAHLVSLAGFDLTVGAKTYTPASGDEVRIKGAFHGVPGTYICTPTGENQCAARAHVKANTHLGVEVGGVLPTGATFQGNHAVWTFKADEPGAKVPIDAGHSTYGWWIAKFEGDTQWIAGAFHRRRPGDSNNGGGNSGRVAPSLNGNATYEGGAAGIYATKPHALGGTTNDAGHFVADARLEANFTTDEIKGTIDNFRTGNIGTSPETERDWSVELMLKDFQEDRDENHIATTKDKTTKWTIGGAAGLASGDWFGGFDQTSNSNTPPSVITGQFYSTYHGVGKIAGGFGANYVPEQ